MPVDHDYSRDAEPAHSNPMITLVMRARNGDERAWAALVERYAPLIWSICRTYRLGDSDATTTRRECERISRVAQVTYTKGYAPDVTDVPDEQPSAAEQLLAADRHP